MVMIWRALAVVGGIFLAWPVFAQPMDTFETVDWASESQGGNCVLTTLRPELEFGASYLEWSEWQDDEGKYPAFLEVISRGEVYEFRANMPAKDDLQFQIWSAGGYQMLFTISSGEDVVLTPAISDNSSPYLAASGDPRKSIWTLGTSFDPKLLIFTATAEVERRTGFRFLLERAEAGNLYVFVPAEIGGTSWEVRLGSSFRDALAAFVRCNQGTSG